MLKFVNGHVISAVNVFDATMADCNNNKENNILYDLLTVSQSAAAPGRAIYTAAKIPMAGRVAIGVLSVVTS